MSALSVTASAAADDPRYPTCDQRGQRSIVPRRILDPNPAYWAPSRHKADSVLKTPDSDLHAKVHRLRFRWQTLDGLAWLCGDQPGERNLEVEARVFPRDDERWSTNWEDETLTESNAQFNLPGPVLQDDIASGHWDWSKGDFNPADKQKHPDFALVGKDARALRYRRLYKVNFTTNQGHVDSGLVIYSAGATRYAGSFFEKRYCEGRGAYPSCTFQTTTICYNRARIDEAPVRRRVDWGLNLGRAFSMKQVARDNAGNFTLDADREVVQYCDPKPAGANDA